MVGIKSDGIVVIVWVLFIKKEITLKKQYTTG